MKRWLVVLGSVLALTGAGAGFLWTRHESTAPTAAAWVNTPTPSSTDTPTPTATSTPAATVTASITPSATATFTSTPTNTLSTLVLQVTAVNTDVVFDVPPVLHNTETPTPLPTVNVPTPPVKVALLPSADTSLIGWYECDVTDPAIRYQGKWDSFTATYRSVNKRYFYTDDEQARLTYRFLGAAVRVRYIAYYTYGVFQIVIDGQVRTTIDSYYPKQTDGRGNFLSTEVFGLAHGWHVLEIVRMGRKAPESAGTMIAIDAIDVYLNGPVPSARPTALPITATLTPSPAPAERIQVIAAPPTVQPTATAVSPNVVSVNFSIAYDLNGNKAIDLVEGVQSISVRLVAADTNQVMVSGYTNEEGFIHLEGMTNTPLRLVVPYFNKYWDIPNRSGTLRITMLIPPANQPGIIP